MEQPDLFYSFYDNCLAASDYIKSKVKERPQILIVCGTGLNFIEEHIKISSTVLFEEIPNFPKSAVLTHKNKFVFGTLSGKDVVVMVGRIHTYESYGCHKPVFPIRVMKLFGIKMVFMTNAVGCLNPEYKVRDLALIKDHIYLPGLCGMNPLVGPNDERFGGNRFFDLKNCYDKELRAKFEESAKLVGYDMKTLHTNSIYSMISGPMFETPAESRFFRMLGVDTIGMSTCPEAVVCAHLGLRLLAVSVVTDIIDMSEDSEVTQAEAEALIASIYSIGAEKSKALISIFSRLLQEI